MGTLLTFGQTAVPRLWRIGVVCAWRLYVVEESAEACSVLANWELC